MKGREESTFFSFFTFLGNLPLKNLQNPNCGRYTHPATMNITPLCSPHDTLHGGVGFVGIR